MVPAPPLRQSAGSCLPHRASSRTLRPRGTGGRPAMRESLLAELACPECGADLAVAEAISIAGGHIEEGALACRGCARRYPIERSVPNFVPGQDRADVVQTTSGFARNWDDFNDVILDNEQLNDELFRDWIAPVEPETFK